MNSYSFLAGCYDQLTYDVRYRDWADYIEKHFQTQYDYGEEITVV